MSFHAVSVPGTAVVAGATTSLALTGSTTNDSAAAGNIGEFISASVIAGSAISMTTSITHNVTSIVLTPGDWDVFGAVDFTFGSTTSYTNLKGGTSTTSAAIGAQDTFFDYETAANVPTAGQDHTWVVPTARYSVAVTTTVWLIASGVFTVSTLKGYGSIRARRMR